MSEGSSRPRTVNKQHSLTPEQQQQRHRRRLPHVQRTGRSRPLTYWPSYKGAVEWLRRHHGILDTALGLLEIYPALIQDRSMDVLWEFISPFFASSGHSKNATVRVRSRPRESHSVASPASKHSRQHKPRTAPSLTGKHRAKAAAAAAAAAAGSNAASSSPKAEDPYLHRGFEQSGRTSSRDPQDLLPLISVTCSQDQPEPELQALFDDEDPPQSAHELPCVYVCCPCQQYPREKEPGCDWLRQNVLHALQHQFYVRTGPCVESEDDDFSAEELSEIDVYVFVLGESSLNSPACLKRLYALWCLNIPSVFVKDCDYCLPSPLPESVLRCIQALESSEMSLTSSAHHFPTPRSATPRCGLSIPTVTTASLDSRQQKQQERGKNGQESDFMLYVLNGYRAALIFEENGLGGCESRLQERIQFIAGVELNQIGSMTSSLTLSTQVSSYPLEARNTLLPNDCQNHLSILTNSQMERSPNKDSNNRRLCENEEEKKGSQQHHRNGPGESPSGVSALSNGNSVPASNHLLSVGYFAANGHPARRLGSPPPVKMTASTVVSASLPPVKSPATSRRQHLDPFTNLPRY